MSTWVTFSPFCVLINAFSFDVMLSVFFFPIIVCCNWSTVCPLLLCSFFVWFNFISKVQYFSPQWNFFINFYWLRDISYLVWVRANQPPMQVQKKYVTKSVSCSLIELFCSQQELRIYRVCTHLESSWILK